MLNSSSLRTALNKLNAITSFLTNFLWAFQFVVFKLLKYCFEETIGFDKYVSFVRPPVSSLIKTGDITKQFQ